MTWWDGWLPAIRDAAIAYGQSGQGWALTAAGILGLGWLAWRLARQERALESGEKAQAGRSIAHAPATLGQAAEPTVLEDLEAKRKLCMFVQRHIAPTCQALDALQEETMRSLIPSKEAQRLACYGLSHEPIYSDFWHAKEVMYEATSGNTLYSWPLADIVQNVIDIRHDYDTFRYRTLRMTNNDMLSPKLYPKWVAQWNRWAGEHNRLVKAHDELCDADVVPQLFQPPSARGFRDIVSLVNPEADTP